MCVVYRHCVKEPHEPCDCKLWQRWTELISTNGDGKYPQLFDMYVFYKSTRDIPGSCIYVELIPSSLYVTLYYWSSPSLLPYTPPPPLSFSLSLPLPFPLSPSPWPVDGAIARLGQEAAANARWIVNFTKPCPHCRSVLYHLLLDYFSTFHPTSLCAIATNSLLPSPSLLNTVLLLLLLFFFC